MTLTMDYTETLVVTSCWCGIRLAIPDNLHTWLHDASGRSCYCPLGHKFVFTVNNETKLKREREQTARLRAELDQTEASLRAQRSATKRFQNKVKRAEAGVCTECNRSFQNLARHMKTKHTHAKTA